MKLYSIWNSMFVNIIHANVLRCYNNNIYIKNWVDKYNVYVCVDVWFYKKKVCVEKNT